MQPLPWQLVARRLLDDSTAAVEGLIAPGHASFDRRTIYRCLRRLAGHEPFSAHHDLRDLGNNCQQAVHDAQTGVHPVPGGDVACTGDIPWTASAIAAATATQSRFDNMQLLVTPGTL